MDKNDEFNQKGEMNEIETLKKKIEDLELASENQQSIINKYQIQIGKYEKEIKALQDKVASSSLV